MLTRYDPFRETLSLRRAMDQLFEQSFVNSGLLPGSQTMMAPMDISETPNGYEVDVALPGVRPEDIELVVDQNTLTIRGRYSQQNERQNQAQGQQQTQTGQAQGTSSQQQGQSRAGQQDGGQQGQQRRQDSERQGQNWISREIVSGAFERTITFPRPIETDKIQTRFQNGILTIQLPVSEENRPRRISITGDQGQPQQVPVEAGQQRQQQR